MSNSISLKSMFIIVISLTACGSMPPSSKRLTVARLGFTDNTPFYARWAVGDGRIIVTDEDRVTSGMNFRLANDSELYGVEFIHEHESNLENEVFRLDRVAFFTAQDERHASMIASDVEEFSHPRKINLQTVHAPNWTSSVSYGENESNSFERPNVTLANANTVVIDPLKMREDLESLSGARPVTIDGQTLTITNRASADMKSKARAWLRATYESLGYTVTESRYASGSNFIAEKRPTNPVDDQIFIVSGHLDTVQTAGADDDGSGVISSLAIARALRDLPLKRTIRFVAFDEEERGLIGSAAYANELVRTGEINKVSVFNIEMTGYDSDNDGDFHTIDCNENSSPMLSRALLSAISQQGIALKKVDACTNRSDHAVFWEHNRPAIVVSQNFFGGDGNPCYHRSCDTTQKLNWDYMAKITKAAANAVVSLNAR